MINIFVDQPTLHQINAPIGSIFNLMYFNVLLILLFNLFVMVIAYDNIYSLLENLLQIYKR
jgi:hypothetical protein